MAFEGWPAEALEFFEGFEADNTKTYWQEHKAMYEAAARAPMEQLLGDLAPEWGDGRIHRPYRDIRFSVDKSPYRTHIAPWCRRATSSSRPQGWGRAAGCGRWSPTSSSGTGRP